MACHLKCPFCPQQPSVGYFYKHLTTQHIASLFDDTTEWGKRNLVWLNAEKVRQTPYILHLPKGETKYCCPACITAVNKPFYIEKHFPKCSQLCQDKLDEYKVLLKITPKEAPFAEQLQSAPTDQKVIEYYKAREQVYQKIIWNMLAEVADKEEWAYWFNQLTEDSEIHARFKELQEEKDMPETEKYDISLECSKELKLLGIRYQQIQEAGRKKLPTLPSLE